VSEEARTRLLQVAQGVLATHGANVMRFACRIDIPIPISFPISVPTFILVHVLILILIIITVKVNTLMHLNVRTRPTLPTMLHLHTRKSCNNTQITHGVEILVAADFVLLVVGGIAIIDAQARWTALESVSVTIARRGRRRLWRSGFGSW